MGMCWRIREIQVIYNRLLIRVILRVYIDFIHKNRKNISTANLKFITNDGIKNYSNILDLMSD